jgi:hypothetical protein
MPAVTSRKQPSMIARVPGEAVLDTVVINGEPRAILRLREGSADPPLEENRSVDRSKRKASLGKGWAHLQLIAYLEWCEVSGEKPLSDMAIARALLPRWAKTPGVAKGFNPDKDRERLAPFFEPLIGGYGPRQKRGEPEKSSPVTAELISFRGLQPLLGKWRKSFRRGERIPEALRLLPPSPRWLVALAAIGRVAVPSFDRRAIETLPRSMRRLRLLASWRESSFEERRPFTAMDALERVAPGLSNRLSKSGLLGEFQSFAEKSGFGTSPPFGHALTLALDFVAALPPDGRVLFDAIHTRWERDDWPDLCEYYLCPEWLEARRFSPEGDCDVIEAALRAQESAVVALPPGHPRRHLMAAMTLRSRAMTEVGADRAQIHHWIYLLRK